MKHNGILSLMLFLYFSISFPSLSPDFFPPSFLLFSWVLKGCSHALWNVFFCCLMLKLMHFDIEFPVRRFTDHLITSYFLYENIVKGLALSPLFTTGRNHWQLLIVEKTHFLRVRVQVSGNMFCPACVLHCNNVNLALLVFPSPWRNGDGFGQDSSA